MTLSDNLTKIFNAIELKNENKHPLILGNRRYVINSFQQQYCVEQTVYRIINSKQINIFKNKN